MDVLQFLNNYWMMVLSIVGVIGWFVRLEVKVSAHAESNDKLWLKMDSLQQQNTNILQAVSRVEGRLEGRRFTEGG